MELLILWCKARAAPDPLCNIFKKPSKLGKELSLNTPIKVGTATPNRFHIGQSKQWTYKYKS